MPVRSMLRREDSDLGRAYIFAMKRAGRYVNAGLEHVAVIVLASREGTKRSGATTSTISCDGKRLMALRPG